MSLTDAYRTVVLSHNRAPHRLGHLAAPDLCASGANALCGDRLTLELKIDGGTVRDFAFAAEASALTLAATSIMGDLICGRTTTEAAHLADAAIDLVTRNPEQTEDPRLGEFNAFLGVVGYPNRIKTVTLPWATLAGALAGRLTTSTDIDIRGAAIVSRAPKQGSAP